MMERVGKQLGHYRLVRLLGWGGFASVYLGEHIHLKSLAAIKVLYARLTEDLQENFRNEARVLAHFSHPGIIRLLDFGIEEAVPFLVMEYAPYGSLRQLHPHHAKLPLVMVVHYVNQIVEGLQYAHDQKLIHRDLKPDNVLIGQRGNLLLSDFGVALIAQTTNSHNPEADFAGTAAYMAPEQLRGMPQFASDQYALGIMVYEWLCGRRPFQGTVVELYSQHSAVPPQSLRTHVPDLPSEVEQVVLRALSKEPDERFPNVKAFAAALEQASQSVQMMVAADMINTFIPPTLPQDNISTNAHTSYKPEEPAPETPLPPPQPSTAPPTYLPHTHTEPSTSGVPLFAAPQTATLPPEQSTLLLPPEQSTPSEAHLAAPQSAQLQKSSALSPAGQPPPEIADIGRIRTFPKRRAISLLAALLLLILLLVSSGTLYMFSQGKQILKGGTTATRVTSLGSGNSASSSGATSTPDASTSTPGATPSSNTILQSNSKSSPVSTSSSKSTVSATSTSSATGAITPTARAASTTNPTIIPTPTPTSKSAAPTPTPAAHRCTTYNWTITKSQSASYTTSANCGSIKVAFSSGTLTQLTMQACTSSGCGSSQLILLGNSVTLLTNVPAGTSFYLKTTSLLSPGTLSGTVSC